MVILQAVTGLINAQIAADQVPQFLVEHLMLDLDILRQAIGKSHDDASVLLHIIFNHMMSLNAGNVNKGV